MAAHWNLQPKYSGYSAGWVHPPDTHTPYSPEAAPPCRMAEIVRTEGSSGLFRGISPTLIGVLPYAGISFSVFGTLKARISSPPPIDDHPLAPAAPC